jgi:DNA repair exonuclease SbcCD ATPase subunit
MEVKMDPRLKTSVDDLQKQFDLMQKLRDRQEEMNRSILAIRDLRVQLNLVEKRWSSKDNAKAVIDQSKELRKKIGAVEDELIQVNSKASEDELNYPTKMNSWLGYLQNAVDSADTAPTEGELGVFAELNQKLDAQLAKWHELLSTDIPAINAAMQKNGIPLISAAPEASH